MKGVRRLGASFMGVLVGALALVVLLPTTAQGSRNQIAPTADGLLGFDVGVSIYDQAVWQYKSQGDCDIYSGTGQHTISADAEPARSSNWTAQLPVRNTGKGYVPVRPLTGQLLLGNETIQPERTASARYNLNSSRTIEPTSNTGDCAPIGCPDCGSSEPPQEKCGTVTGSVEFRIVGSAMPANAKRASFLFEDLDWTPERPFQTEKTYCEEGGFWHWQDGWPGFMTTDDGPYLRVDTSKLLGYFRKLGPKQRLKCNVFIDLPNYCSRANYIRRSRTIQREEINLPGISSFKEQISNLFLEFRFASYTQFRKNGSVCFPRPGKKC